MNELVLVEEDLSDNEYSIDELSAALQSGDAEVMK